MAGSRARGWVVINHDECIGCGMCLVVCPTGCLEATDGPNSRGIPTVRYVGQGCRADGICYRACPQPGAITVMRAG